MRFTHIASGLACAAIALASLAVPTITSNVQASSGHFSPAVTTGVGSLITPLNEAPNPVQGPDGLTLFSCQSNSVTVSGGRCYGPDQIRTAYDVQSLLDGGTDGTGRTIVIIDAFGSPTIAADFAAFNSQWNLSSATLNVFTPFGVASTSAGNARGWATESSLDVEWSHVFAPNATIDLVVSRSDSDQDIYNAEQFAVNNNLGDVISMSYGENESCEDPGIQSGEHALWGQALAKGITLFASAGDDVAAQFNCDGTAFVLATSTPASDPQVMAVGGTELTADGVSGAYGSETAWNTSVIRPPTGTGGGFSVIFPRPAYESGVPGISSFRGLPDVSLNASIVGAIIVYFNGRDITVGGTSVASPEWAGIIALADQHYGQRLGDIHNAVYQLGLGSLYGSFFHDITTGDNTWSGHITGYNTGTGWDPVTGWGTPRVSQLIQNLAAYHLTVTLSLPAPFTASASSRIYNAAKLLGSATPNSPVTASYYAGAPLNLSAQTVLLATTASPTTFFFVSFTPSPPSTISGDVTTAATYTSIEKILAASYPASFTGTNAVKQQTRIQLLAAWTSAEHAIEQPAGSSTTKLAAVKTFSCDLTADAAKVSASTAAAMQFDASQAYAALGGAYTLPLC